jgi:hypothetical protein
VTAVAAGRDCKGRRVSRGRICESRSVCRRGCSSASRALGSISSRGYGHRRGPDRPFHMLTSFAAAAVEGCRSNTC